MNIVNLSRKKFDSLKPLDISNSVTNTEGVLYELYYKGRLRVFKKLHLLSGGVFANKLYTLEMLDNNKEFLPDCFVIPNYLGIVSGQVVGVLEDFIEGVNLEEILLDYKINTNVQINYLKGIGEILEELKYMRINTQLTNFYINDLHAGNFLITKDKKLKVIDLDSSKLCDNKPFPSKYLLPNTIIKNSNKYTIFGTDNVRYSKELGYYDADENSDLYCYVITILNYLYKGNVHRMELNEYYDYLNYLESIGFNNELLTIFERIILNCDNKNPKDYLDEITTTQIGRASSKVYNKVRG